MANRSRTPSNLPPATPSEAAFERAFDALTRVPAAEAAQQPAEEPFRTFADRLFANSQQYLVRDPFAGIGERESFPTKVVGISFGQRQDLAAALEPGAPLDLRREPENPADSNAIAVYYGNLQLGFLRRQIAAHLAPLIDAGAVYRARVEHVTGGGEKNFGTNIRVEREGRMRASSAALPNGLRAGRETIRAALIGAGTPHAAQRAALERIDAGRNTLTVLGTGRGKSFCFQYPAAYRALESEQKTLMLYPLRALANDQYESLCRRFDGLGLRIHRANGAIGAEERADLFDALASGAWDIILATPEFLQYHRTAFTGVSAPGLVVVDEAHHIYESKHRGAYGTLGETIRSLGSPQVVAATATAREDAFEQIVEDLEIDAWVIDPTVRENLHLVDARGTKEKAAYLESVFAGGEKGIVYCNSRTESTKTADALRKRIPGAVLFYHAGMPTAERTRVEDAFRSGELQVVVATSAFGEGIDLPDVRHVVLYHLNFDFTEFNQQAGRAGRDGKPAQIHLLFGESDRRINEFIIDREAPTVPLLRELYKGLRGLARGGLLRMPFTEIARTLDLDKADERTVSTAVRIFEEEHLLETGIDDDGRYLRLLPVDGKVDIAQNERFAEGQAEREQFAHFAEFVLSADSAALERIVNRPIYPGRVALQR